VARRVRLDDGSLVSLTDQVGEGREGAVFLVAEEPSWAAKLLAGRVGEEHQRKLRFMRRVEHRHSRLFRENVAWVLRTLHSGDRVVGYVMPLVSDAVSLDNVSNPYGRQIKGLPLTFKDLLVVGLNLCAVVGEVHEFGYLVGDFNKQNVLVTWDLRTVLIDAASFQVDAPHGVYLSEVAVAEYSPPEVLQGDAVVDGVRSRNQNYFSLAVILFELLMGGHHPYSGVLVGGGELSTPERIQRHLYAHAGADRKLGISPPANCVNVNVLPASTVRMFEAAFSPFGYLHRPNVREWSDELKRMYRGLTQCFVNAAHQYPSHNVSCPWCASESAKRMFPTQRPLSGYVVEPANGVIARVATDAGAITNLVKADVRTLVATTNTGYVHVVDPITGHVEASIHAHKTTITHAVHNPVTNVLTTASPDGQITQRNTDTLQIIKNHQLKNTELRAIATNQTGTHLAAADSNKTITIWVNDNPPTTIQLNQNNLRTLAFMFDGRLVGGFGDGVLCVWGVGGGDPTMVSAHAGAVTHVVTHPADDVMITAGEDRVIRVWDHAVRALHSMLVAAEVRVLSVNQASNKIVATLANNQKHEWVFNQETFEVSHVKQSFASTNPTVSIVNNVVAEGTRNGTIIIGTRTAPRVVTFHQSSSKPLAAALNRDGSLYAIQESKSVIQVIDTSTKKIVAVKPKIAVSKFGSTFLQFSPDNKTLVCTVRAANHAFIILINLATNEQTFVTYNQPLVDTTVAHNNHVISALVMTGLNNSLIEIRRINNGTTTTKTHHHTISDTKPTIIYTPTNRNNPNTYIGMRNGRIHTLTAHQTLDTNPYYAHTTPITAIATNHNDTHLVSASTDGTLTIHDIQTQQLIHKTNTKTPITDITYSQDDQHIHTSNNEGAIQTFNTKLHHISTTRPTHEPLTTTAFDVVNSVVYLTTESGVTFVAEL
jgi:WD40 repeat protein